MIVSPSDRYIHPDFWELLEYDPEGFRPDWCSAGDEKGEKDAANYKDAFEFSQKTKVFCYQSIGLMAQGVHRPYIARILQNTADYGALSLIDVGAGGGQLALAFHSLGFKVSLADIWGESVRFATWRLRRRGLRLPVYLLNTVPGVEIPHHQLATCFDVLEHLTPEEQGTMLQFLGEIADIVYVNAVHDAGHPHLHFPVDVEAHTARLRKHWTVDVSAWYPDAAGKPKQHLLVYGDGVHEQA